ncbi:type I methionyl aminopeptidase [Patescibacteria group bacterium]|nr:type I methionyl aminopeptidase [Patescibacteria group bacterium]
MSLIKSPEEIEKLKRGGAILSRALVAAMKVCVAGATTVEIDRVARETMEAEGAKPSFLGYRISMNDPAYPGTICISINDEVVHGLATPSRTIKNGDVVGLDIGCWFEGLATDMASTVMVGDVSQEVKDLCAATKQSLRQGLSVIKSGALVSEISAAVEDALKPKYGIVRDLVGHGVGHAVHEEPQIPNFRDARAPKIKLQTGMVLAIEPMVTMGDWRVAMKDDGWTIVTRDHSTAAHEEVTIAVTDDGYELITPWPTL